MNKTYSIQIRHHLTRAWTQVCTVVTSDPSRLQAEFEADYGQEVRVVEVKRK